MEKIPMTRKGYEAIEAELKQLKSVERPAIIRAISEAREHGDLSENAEYHSAKEKQSFIEGRIKELEGAISLSDVIDPTKLSGPIKFGATVTLVDPRACVATGIGCWDWRLGTVARACSHRSNILRL